MSGQVVVENYTGHPLHRTGCISLFAVALGNHKIKPTVAWPMCAQPFTIPVGESIYPVTVRATYLSCDREGSWPHCTHGRPPSLPPGTYRATLFQIADIVPTPPPVSVRVTP